MRFLVVDDEEFIGTAIGKLLSPYGEAFVVQTSKAAQETLAAHDTWSAFFVDIRLPDGSGLDFLARARREHPKTPAMVLSGAGDLQAVNAAFDLDAHYVAKPFDASRIVHFLLLHPSFSERLHGTTLAWQERFKLSGAETNVLRRAALGETREQIAEGRNCSLLTVKAQVAGILHKTGDATLSAAVGRLLRVVAGDEPAP